MTIDHLMVIGAAEVAELLRDEEDEILATVERAYRAHGRGDAVVPHSTFLRFPGGRDRMIALPAYLGDDFDVAGVKWIASFPGNLRLGLERASGLVVLSSMATGRPMAVVEGSLVSAKRTAASAALAARVLHGAAPVAGVGIVGCGAINFETLRFLLHVWPGVEHVVAYDSDPARSARFAVRSSATFAGIRVEVVSEAAGAIRDVALLSIATTAMTPWLAEGVPESLRTILHLSLRDLSPTLILAADNVVDDADHVCRADTSLHLAEGIAGNRRFIRCDLPTLLNGGALPTRQYGGPTIFSPFGLGILDIAVAKLVWERAEAGGVGTRLRFSSTAAA